VFPALTGSAWKHTLGANAVANLIRNYWAYMVIFCGHFPDGAEKFIREEFENETQAEWYLRQMLGSANFHAGPLMAFMSGNLCYQIEHHLFPDLPSNRYAEIGERVRPLRSSASAVECGTASASTRGRQCGSCRKRRWLPHEDQANVSTSSS
jgi:linoleoyl-CoA desaturase